MFSIKKCLVVAMALTAGLVALGGECQAGVGYVFGKAPVASHNMAMAKKRLAAQAPRYRYAAPSYGAVAYRSAPSRSIASNTMVYIR
jgi:hypothetical protein